MENSNSKRRVLIVDDHAILRDSIRMIIDDTPDFEVVGEAETAAEAVETCRTGDFDVILLDVRLPDKSGCEVAREIRSNGTSAKIVALSMRDEESVRRQMIEAGSDTFVSKAAGAEALDWLARKMDEQFGLQIRLKTDSAPKVENISLKTFLYRATHELLFNTVKHAGVKRAEVALFQADGHLTLTVCDQGDGFDPPSLDSPDTHTGLGLISLRERTRFFGGRFEIDSAPGKGSRFTLRIPESPPSSDPP